MQCVTAGYAHRWVEGSATKNSGKDVLQVRCEVSLHHEGDSLPCAKQVDTLGITLFELGVLDGQKHLDHIVGNRRKCILSTASADDCNSFNDLASELLVLRLVELV
jgi:hypothetical protein